MTRNLSFSLQSLAVAGQIIIPTIPMSQEWIKVGHAVVAAIQAILAIAAHSSNPDGTPASVSYMPDKPKLP